MNKPQYDIDEAWVQRYREGKLSEEEQHWLKENSFEAEALEGLAETTSWSEDMSTLQQQLQERTTKRTTLWATYSRYAASIAVLLTVGWLAYWIVSSGSNSGQQLSSEKESKAPAYEAQPNNSGAEKNNSLALMAPEKIANERATAMASNPVPSPPSHEVKPVPVPERQTSALLEPAATPSLAGNDALADEELPNIIEEITEETERELSLSRRNQSRAKQARFAFPSEQFAHQVSGSVYSAEDHVPLPGVNVQVKGTIVGTVTDVNGQFKVAVPDSTSSELVFSFMGYQPEKIAVGKQDSVVVQMEADGQTLSEVVVTQGYHRSDKINSAAHPVPSYDSFRNYLQTSLRYPKEAKQQGVEGVVKVQFTVRANGSLTDFEIKKGLGYGCDEEAIRLMKEGPTWQPATRNGDFQPDQVTVKVRFKLPA